MRQDACYLPSAFGSERTVVRLEGTHFYRKFRNSSQPALVRGSDEKLHMVEWCDPVHRPYRLASQVIGHALLAAVGLPAPSWKPLFASQAFIEANPDMWPRTLLEQCSIAPGLHFASEFLGTERTHTLFEWIPTRWRHSVSNSKDLLGAWVFDIWVGARNPRKILFRQEDGTRTLQAFFVDNAELFGGSGWQFSKCPVHMVNDNISMYSSKWDEETVMSWVARIRATVPAALDGLSELVPSCWHGGDVNALPKSFPHGWTPWTP